MPDRRFIDTNAVLYFAGTGDKAAIAEALLAQGGVISVQVLNEMANVCRRKFGYDWESVDRALALVRALTEVVPLGLETHELGLALARRHRLAIFDAMLVASALIAECTIFLSEDMQDGLVVEDRLLIRNPFARA